MTYGDVLSNNATEPRVLSHVPDAGRALFLGGYSVYSLPRETLEARVTDACEQGGKLQDVVGQKNRSDAH